MSAAIPAELAPRVGARTRSPFYVIFSFVLLAIVVTGFTPSFFLNAFMAKRPIPIHVFLHGVFATSWFVLLCLQSLLVYRGKTSLHRRIGTVGVVISSIVPISIAIAGIMAFPRLLGLGLPPPLVETILGGARAGQIGRDVGSGLFFFAFVAFALYWRFDTEVHKRLMMQASIILSGPALARFGWITPGVLSSHAFPFVVTVALIAALCIHDLATLGRLHRATRFGGLVTVAGTVILVTLVPMFVR